MAIAREKAKARELEVLAEEKQRALERLRQTELELQALKAAVGSLCGSVGCCGEVKVGSGASSATSTAGAVAASGEVAMAREKAAAQELGVLAEEKQRALERVRETELELQALKAAVEQAGVVAASSQVGEWVG